ncbi:hypothetical protein ILUMI_25290 [Ignelater luminosus]|uniref:Uncharacterized protein n=1 Tax=Ignelater luminosus TaxID=2038154 RepID=A0A8K0CAU3_IGNLU|nr:hypothetical protein ILUMI_25290 [Ignelater luminosus]
MHCALGIYKKGLSCSPWTSGGDHFIPIAGYLDNVYPLRALIKGIHGEKGVSEKMNPGKHHYNDQSDEDKEDSLEKTDPNGGDSSSPYFLGKDNAIKWNKHVPRRNIRTRSWNIIEHLLGAKTITKNLKSILEIWQYFIDMDMIRGIVEHTNKHIRSV